MEEVNVLMLCQVDRLSLERLAAVAPKVRVYDGSRTFVPSKGLFREQPQAAAREELDRLLARADVICGFAPPSNLSSRAPRLKWIHALSAGVDAFLVPDIIESPVLLTNSRGIHGVQVSETAIMMMLMLAKQEPRLFRQQIERKWERLTPGVLHAKTIAVLGLGTIGKEVAIRAKAFGMKVIAVEAESAEEANDIDQIFPPGQLIEALSQSDYVVITLPLTPQTRGLIGESELKSMKRTAFLINVARGGIVDEEALVRALAEKWIAGAGLDVFAVEPLPPESKLWDIPNLIITPHMAGDREDYLTLALDVFRENLRRYLAGEDLINLVDKRRGY